MKEIFELDNQLDKTLLEANLENKIETPHIAVVGQQSSGKTSVLEMIMGVDCLPRGSGIVTKAALRCQLYNHQEEEDYVIFDHKDKKFTVMDEVREEITRRTLELLDQEPIEDEDEVSNESEETKSSEVNIPKQTVTMTPIVMSLYSMNVANLVLIDLPGLVGDATDGQSQKLPAKIRELAKRNIESKKTIILFINPANGDTANNTALELVKEVDPNRERTFGVITKIDLMDKGEDPVNLFEGNGFKLKHEYIAVKCRSKQDTTDGMTINKAKDVESNYFNNHPEYQNKKSQAGTGDLTKMLSHLLVKAIKDDLPNIQKDIEKNIVLYEKRLNMLGKSLDITNDTQAYEYFITIIDGLHKEFKQQINGDHTNFDELDLSGGSYIKRHFESFNKKLIDPIDPFEDISDVKILNIIRKSLGVNSGLFIPEEACKNLIKKNIERLYHPISLCCERVREILYATIQEIINKSIKGK